jgi:hypothetical protein
MVETVTIDALAGLKGIPADVLARFGLRQSEKGVRLVQVGDLATE